jgi:hypothetical protein
MSNKSKDAPPISIRIDGMELFRQTKRGTANFLGAVARLVDPNFDRQDILSLTPQERERSLQLSQRVAEVHLGQITTLYLEFGLLGGRTAAKTNPQAERLLLTIEQKEKTLAEIKFDGQPVITNDQIYRMEKTCQMAAEELRQASTTMVVNTIGLDNVIGMLSEGISPGRITQPVNDLLQDALKILQQQNR